MKKLLVALFVLVIAIPTFAGLKEKDVIGKWSYKVTLDEGELTGVFQFEKKDGKLAGEVITSEGESIVMSTIEIKDNNVVYFEITPEYDVMKISITVDGKKYAGTVGTYDGSIDVTGEKIE